MAEALGILSSVISMYQLLDRANHIISKVRHAPTELLALHNEVSDLTATLRTVEACLRATIPGKASTPNTQHMTELIESAKNHLIQLNQLIHMRFLESGSIDGDHRVFRLRWARSKSTVERHRTALRDIKNNIMTELMSAT